ncbi:MAG: type VI secretion system tip protein VgrG [Alphaproteobacteria bacterium]|nr:MAG: type VI secretion system tip protein VgrG [Alphaproteobacteria bacterium]
MATVGVKTQNNVTLNLEEKFAKKGYALQRLTCTEGLSTLFEVHLDLIADQEALSFKEVIGKPLQATCEYGSEKHYFQGVVGHVSQRDTAFDTHLTHYRLTLYPSLWLLKFTKKYRIFQKKSTKEIIAEIIKEHDISAFKNETKTRGKDKREYCVQYNESDYDFIQRLMEEEGIAYHFKQEKSGHTLVLTDSNATFKPFRSSDTIEIQTATTSPGMLHTLLGVRMDHRVIPTSYALKDYNFTTPTTDLDAEAKDKYAGGEMVTYPGQSGYEEDPTKAINSSYANMRLEAEEASQNVLCGSSTFPDFHPGTTLTLKKHLRKDFNGKFVIRKVTHVIDGIMDAQESNRHLLYKNDFEAFYADTDYRPPCTTPKPSIASIQTATVTGPKNKEVYTDKYGRIKVRFHWDPEKKGDEKSSCWVRTSQNWSDKEWGFVFIPRIGQEVIITFLNGDPDRPIVTGSVYNGTHLPPYLPKTPTKSTIRTQTVGTPKGKPKGFNELRFEDKYESEEIFIHAEKDWNTVVNETRTTLIEEGSDEKTIDRGDRVIHIKGEDKPVKGKGDDLLTIDKGSRTVKLLAKGKGKGDYTIEMKKGDRTLTITKGDMEITIKKGNRTVKMDKGNHKFTIKSGNETITIDKGNQVIAIKNGTRSVFVKKDEKHTNKASYKQDVTKDWNIKVTGDATIKATGDLTLKSTKNITIKAGVALNMEAPTIEMKAKTALKAKSEAMFQMEAGSMMEVKSGGVMKVKAAAAYQMEAATVLVKTDAAFTVKAGAAVVLKSDASIAGQSSGPIVLKGTPVLLG